MRTPEPQLLTDAAKALAQTTGLTVVVPPCARHHQDERIIDGQLRLQWDDQTRIYPVELKATITNTALGAVADRVNRLAALLITRHVMPPQAHCLRELGAQFADTAGNAYLKDPPLGRAVP